ncbi:carotenoid biosynthesis protein [Oscillatoria sp. FACHB-1407]|uniref:gamma-carotene 1'-hydroxylase CruF n=1 Tax=Oscillatoria sp. FACHB-1407 TaxID=2692847 RepID=UPI001682A780|nr:carotenoid biosynthesis protein [Oscillatoria sp. FACHB-1407]MBD2465950.1 carotenoid biosynthesis protein [Oscillatoria sp. FACHB-1407]
MKQLVVAERYCLIGHLVAMAFGLAGLLIVMPHPEFLAHVPGGQTMFAWSMAGGGVVYILLGAIAVAIHAYRTLGLTGLLTFLVPAVGISLTSELLGTSTGFPFGNYSYLSGLGYKIAGLVPFTIPLSWFYLGLSSYLLARVILGGNGANPGGFGGFFRQVGAIALGALLLTSWDFVLDPAMSQTAMPFWYWHQPGAFFGMPYQNFAGWFGTGFVFMTVAALFWRKRPPQLQPAQLNFPLVVYLGNFVFAMVMSLAAGIWIPVLLGIALGVAPAVICWSVARSSQPTEVPVVVTEATTDALKARVATASVGVSAK